MLYIFSVILGVKLGMKSGVPRKARKRTAYELSLVHYGRCVSIIGVFFSAVSCIGVKFLIALPN